MAEAIIFTGLQGAGKTTYFQSHLARTHEHINRDILRTVTREKAVLSACINAGRSFVVDNTNGTREQRAPYIQAAKAAGFRVCSYFFDVRVRTAIGRNNHRQDKKPIPVVAILRAAKLLERPMEAEGFDQMRIVTEQSR